MGCRDINRLHRRDNIVKARKAALSSTQANTFTRETVGTLGLIQIAITIRDCQVTIRNVAVLDALLPLLNVFIICAVFDAMILKLAKQLNANNAIKNEEEKEKQGDTPNLLARFLENRAI